MVPRTLAMVPLMLDTVLPTQVRHYLFVFCEHEVCVACIMNLVQTPQMLCLLFNSKPYSRFARNMSMKGYGYTIVTVIALHWITNVLYIWRVLCHCHRQIKFHSFIHEWPPQVMANDNLFGHLTIHCGGHCDHRLSAMSCDCPTGFRWSQNRHRWLWPAGHTDYTRRIVCLSWWFEDFSD